MLYKIPKVVCMLFVFASLVLFTTSIYLWLASSTTKNRVAHDELSSIVLVLKEHEQSIRKSGVDAIYIHDFKIKKINSTPLSLKVELSGDVELTGVSERLCKKVIHLASLSVQDGFCKEHGVMQLTPIQVNHLLR